MENYRQTHDFRMWCVLFTRHRVNLGARLTRRFNAAGQMTLVVTFKSHTRDFAKGSRGDCLFNDNIKVIMEEVVLVVNLHLITTAR